MHNIPALAANEAAADTSLAACLLRLGVSDTEAAVGIWGLAEPMGACLGVKSVSSGRYVFVSPGLDRLFERTESSIRGCTDADLLRSDEVQAMRRVEQAAMAQRTVIQTEHKLDLGGRRREFLVGRVALGQDHVMSVWFERTEERHRESHLQRALQQIEQQQKQMEQLRRDLQLGSGRDDLSGLYMRPQFDDQLLREIDLSSREHREFALAAHAKTKPLAIFSQACFRQKSPP